MGKRSAAGPRKVKKIVPEGVVHLRATFNNTHVCITDKAGNTVACASGGVVGFKGSRKSTPFAAQLAAEHCGKKALDCGMKTVEVHINGPGSGRESAIRALQNLGFRVLLIKDLTPLPHNGCRPPKRRRI
ncbi:TPA: 30S ribosomal protein S11 [Candidatus Sumerlaeota bacterium]|jgi:small subunit ribosomal protein S11|nr:30S ribosomal protein S11 [Candidatus Sumerlaeota bacterium]